MTRHWSGALPAAMRDPARILVVDDVADNVEILRMRLAQGYEVIAAADGEEALAASATSSPTWCCSTS